MKRVLALLFTLAVFAFLAPQRAAATEVPLYEYWHPNVGDHFYTINLNELGQYPCCGWNFEGVAANVFDSYQSGTVPLYRYYNYQVGDHFYTTDWNELGYGAHGWYFEWVECYVYPTSSYSGVPFYEYWNEQPLVLDHYYTTDFDELGWGAYGWEFSEIMCRVELPD